MKKLLLCFVFLYFFAAPAFAQSLISISPNNAIPGQSLTTLVTASGMSFQTGSPPFTTNFYLKKTAAPNIYPSNIFVIDDDHFDASWSIPGNAPMGTYDVVYDPCMAWGWSCPFSLAGSFFIGESQLTGKVWFDGDSSLTQNGSELGMFNQQLLLLPDSTFTTTGTDGSYSFGTLAGPKTIKVLPSANWKSTTDSTLSFNATPGTLTGFDFGLKGIIDLYGIDVSITSSVVPRCFWSRPYVITYTNTGTVVTHGEIKYIMPLTCTFDSSSVPYNSVVGNTYTFNYTNLQPNETRNIIVWVTLPGAGNIITSTAQGNAQNPQNAIVTQDEAFIVQTVGCSFDPNDKSVIPEGVYTPHYTLMSDSLDFVIRFQNTGNDTAFKVVILDTLNKNVLDLNTFEMITYSHPVNVSLKPNGKLTFTFDNILLPDSNVNEPGSHGFVRFRLRAKAGLPNNTVLNNRCFIYFDLNSPVITNTTLNTLVYQIPVGIADPADLSKVVVTPNPVTTDAVFSLPDNGKSHELKIYDSTGKLLYHKSEKGKQIVVPVGQLKQGILFYKVTESGSSVEYNGRFVVM